MARVQLDDDELLDALDRARELHDQHAALVARLEHRLDHRSVDPAADRVTVHHRP
jgi:hypothetical protein